MPSTRPTNLQEADVVWLLADWAWDQLPLQYLGSRPVITTVHHIVLEKWVRDAGIRASFHARDKITTAYHVPNERTAAFVRGITTKPVHIIPYWANTDLWKPHNKINARAVLDQEFGSQLSALPYDTTVIGSFQRDTEGSDLISPKLEKGPDLFCDYVITFTHFVDHPVHILLGGWRRQYVINRLTAVGIPYTYIEKPSDQVINTMYGAIDLYVVSSRCEGGPQALIECGLTERHTISTPVGMAEQVLSPKAINVDLLRTIPEIPNVTCNMPVNVLPQYEALFRSVLKR